MDDYRAFRPGGRSILVMASTLSPLTGGQCSTRPGGDITYLLTNRGTNDAVVGYGMTSGEANGRAVFPLIGTPGVGGAVELLARTQVVVTLTPNLFFFAATDSGNSAIIIRPGDGV